jgi:uncharacterized protein YoxC
MSKRETTDSSELVNIAKAIEEELRKFESLAEDVRNSPLRSQKHLEKMGKTMHAVADCDERLVGHMRTLLGVLNTWRDRQQALATEVNSQAKVLQERTSIFQALMERMGALGQEAASLSKHVQDLFGRAQQPSEAPMKAEELISALQSVNERMLTVAETAKQLASDAETQDFADVARDAESLRQQILSAHNRANLLQQKLHPATA